MLRLFTESYIKRAHSQCLDHVGIRKISSVGYGYLQASGGMNAVDWHEVLRGPSYGIAPFIMRFRVSCSKAEIIESWFCTKESCCIV
jgi:hypothetical protein